MLFPILKMCLKYAIRYQDVNENLKVGFIKAAQDELNKSGRKVSVSRISAMTGINRREVSRLIDSEFSLVEMKDLATKVIGQWQSDNDFTDKSGQPRALSSEGTNSDFFKLVQKVSSDLAPYTILYELERLNIIEKDADKVKLNVELYQAEAGNLEEGFSMLGEDIADIIAAVQDNTFSSHPIPNLHLKTEYNRIPVEKVNLIREWLLVEGSAFHKKVRDYLSDYDLDLNPNLGESKGSVKVSYCSFSYSEDGEKVEDKQG